MTALAFTHVSVHAPDVEVSARFYADLLGLERVPSPDFGRPVAWLRLGGAQLHLFAQEGEAPRRHHFGVHVDDFERVFARARELGVLERPYVRVLPDGAAQMYLRDPAGNRVEVNGHDASTLDRSVVDDLRPIEDERPQSAEARSARLYEAVRVAGG